MVLDGASLPVVLGRPGGGAAKGSRRRARGPARRDDMTGRCLRRARHRLHSLPAGVMGAHGVLHAFVPGAADQRTCRQRRRSFHRESGPERSAAAAAEEGRERRRHRHGGERLDRRPLRALPPREGGALLALAQMRA